MVTPLGSDWYHLKHPPGGPSGDILALSFIPKARFSWPSHQRLSGTHRLLHSPSATANRKGFTYGYELLARLPHSFDTHRFADAVLSCYPRYVYRLPAQRYKHPQGIATSQEPSRVLHERLVYLLVVEAGSPGVPRLVPTIEPPGALSLHIGRSIDGRRDGGIIERFCGQRRRGVGVQGNANCRGFCRIFPGHPPRARPVTSTKKVPVVCSLLVPAAFCHSIRPQQVMLAFSL